MAGIKDWAEDDRPREKLLLKGCEALSNSELLAILIKSGTPGNSAVKIAKNLLAAAQNDLKKLTTLSVNEIVNMQIKGLGPAKAIAIAAALELGTRRSTEEHRKEVLSKSSDTAKFLMSKLQHKNTEIFAAVYLNNSNKVLHYEELSEGGFTSTVADPRVILKKALEHSATALILSHNHPSGNLKPSKQDISFTKKIKEAVGYLDIILLDHIIVSNEGFFSFADEGIL